MMFSRSVATLVDFVVEYTKRFRTKLILKGISQGG
jgi:hypothetical protein